MTAPQSAAVTSAQSQYRTPIDALWGYTVGWWRNDVADGVEHGKVLQKIAAESSLTPRYIFMICMSAGIAILGLLLSSPAVVIGAMLLSPLMGPILGAGFALAEGKFTWLRLCAKALFWGTLVAILFCALIVWLSPLQTVTEEIASRTRPSLFDLLVALFSALAGSYAMIRGREGTIVGVAIATALMPPLAVVGFGLATWNWTVFGGALMLFVTNLLTIALSAFVMARLYGFKSTRSSRQGMFESVGILITFIALAIPLGFSLVQIANESNGQRIVRNTIEDAFDPQSRIDTLEIDWDADPVLITASVLTPEFRANANTDLGRSLARALDEELSVRIDQFRVGTNPGAAEQAALAQARAREQAEATERQIAALGERLALVAGVERSAVLVDRDNRRAVAQANTLEGLTLTGYRELERRLAAQAPGWSVELRPPLLPLPDITVGEDGLDADNALRLALVGWAASRTGVRAVLTGGEEAIDTAMAGLGDDARFVETRISGDGSTIATAWSAPGSDTTP
ncbi:DUF389 domain-containing protein [Qipengyuania sp. G39]|uniref:DUF389 domain-containing protein n=1 Tax=Qipengyuania profundimaris TaxID=3067652 RepID=A0ABT9HLG8_9SPHN|nr:DUF389 domain-containing protein [Qipengyuania sp. G39]MDP4573987.1 DUF389 domain-containing protein [Qipengyuania sp. G39]